MARIPQTEWHTNSRGERVRILGWSADGDGPTLLIHHGLGEHIGRYQTFADHLPKVSIWGYDARGHGESDGARGHNDGLEGMAADLEQMIPALLEASGAAKVVLFGHSMGAATVGHYMTTRTPHPAIVGVAMSAPPLALELSTAAKIKLKVGKYLAKIAPSTTLGSELDHHGISSVPEQVQRYLRDPLVHDRISLALATGIVNTAPQIIDNAHKLTLPLLLVHGSEDPIAIIRGTRALALAIPSATFREFEGSRHEIHHEQPEHVRALFDTLRDFITPLQ